MSNTTNEILLERAGEMMEYWTGTLHEKLIKHALDENDLERLAELVATAEGEAAQAEMEGYDLVPHPQKLPENGKFSKWYNQLINDIDEEIV